MLRGTSVCVSRGARAARDTGSAVPARRGRQGSGGLGEPGGGELLEAAFKGGDGLAQAGDVAAESFIEVILAVLAGVARGSSGDGAGWRTIRALSMSGA